MVKIYDERDSGLIETIHGCSWHISETHRLEENNVTFCSLHFVRKS